MRPGWGLNGSNIDDDEGTGVQSKKSRVRYAKYSRIDGVCPEPSSSSNDKKKAEVPSFATSTGAFWGLPEPLVPTAAQKAVVRRRDGRQNVLFVMADDLRPELGAYGRQEVLTPYLDRFASQALVFDRAYVQAVTCNPSRNSILSGRRPDMTVTWAFENAYPDKWVSWPEYFKHQGYKTFQIGKVHHWHDTHIASWTDTTGSADWHTRVARELWMTLGTASPLPPTDATQGPLGEFRWPPQGIAAKTGQLSEPWLRGNKDVISKDAPGKGGVDWAYRDRVSADRAIRALKSLSSKTETETETETENENENAPPRSQSDIEEAAKLTNLWALERLTNSKVLEVSRLYNGALEIDRDCRDDPTWANAFRWKCGDMQMDGGTTGSWKSVDGRTAESACCIYGKRPAENKGGGVGGSDHPPPFFLAVGFSMPHQPWIFPRDPFWSCYDRQKLPPAPLPHLPRGSPPFAIGDLFPSLSNLHIDKEGKRPRQPPVPGQCHDLDSVWKTQQRPECTYSPDKPMPDYALQFLLHGYYASVSFLDAQVGRVLGMLEETGLRDDTLVVFTSDHGFALGDNGGIGKRSLFEHDAKVPLIIRDPRHPQSQGRRTQSFFELVDLFPTTAALARANYHGGKYLHHPYHLSSMHPLLDGADQSEVFAAPGAVHKAWAVTQISRCLPRPREPYPHMPPWARFDPNDLQCEDVPSKWDTLKTGPCLPLMGYSLRVEGWRYTMWLRWNTTTYKAHLPSEGARGRGDAIVAEELYRHAEDGRSGREAAALSNPETKNLLAHFNHESVGDGEEEEEEEEEKADDEGRGGGPRGENGTQAMRYSLRQQLTKVISEVNTRRRIALCYDERNRVSLFHDREECPFGKSKSKSWPKGTPSRPPGTTASSSSSSSSPPPSSPSVSEEDAKLTSAWALERLTNIKVREIYGLHNGALEIDKDCRDDPTWLNGFGWKCGDMQKHEGAAPTWTSTDERTAESACCIYGKRPIKN